MKTEILTQNQKSWNTVADRFNGFDVLPSSAPFTQNDEELHVFDTIQEKKCAGYRLWHWPFPGLYGRTGAAELWGVDFSEVQINTSKETLKGLQVNLHCTAMEEEIEVVETDVCLLNIRNSILKSSSDSLKVFYFLFSKPFLFL